MGKGRYFGPIFDKDRECRSYTKGNHDGLSNLIEATLNEAISEKNATNNTVIVIGGSGDIGGIPSITDTDTTNNTVNVIGGNSNITSFTDTDATYKKKAYISQELSKILSFYDKYFTNNNVSVFVGFVLTTLQEARKIGSDKRLCYLINSRIDKASVHYPVYMINNRGSGMGVRWRNRFKYKWFYASLYIYGFYATYLEKMNTLRHEIASLSVASIKLDSPS